MGTQIRLQQLKRTLFVLLVHYIHLSSEYFHVVYSLVKKIVKTIKIKFCNLGEIIVLLYYITIVSHQLKVNLRELNAGTLP